MIGPGFRGLGRAGIVALLVTAAVDPASAQEPEADAAAAAAPQWRTESSLIRTEEPEAPFERYSYVNPDAPKGGTLNQIATGTFDSFNPFIVRGTGAAGLNYFGGLLWDTLMQQSLEEPGTSHGLIADAFHYPEDYSSATYRIDQRARWHDGEPITAQDVVWSFEKLKELSPMHSRYFANVTQATARGDDEVEFTFDQAGNRELPHIMGDLPVLPRHWWEGEDAAGQQRNIAEPTLEPPLGSGPYRIDSFTPGSRIVWSRVEDYWAAELPVNLGRFNFDRRRYTYFQDDNAAWQAFTRGGLEDFRRENRAARWATGYNFPAFEAGDVVKRVFETSSGQPMQGFALNMRRPQFQDRRVREAFTHAFDFESLNRTIFYDSYARTTSYFQGGELASDGLPEGLELEILESVRGEVPDEVFTTEFTLPAFDTPASNRDNLRRASELLSQAGWSRPQRPSTWQRVLRFFRIIGPLPDPNYLVDAQGQRFTVEFLGTSPSDEQVTGGFIENLRRLGIDATLRIIDTSQYINRLRTFDFDITTDVQQQSSSPGNEQRDYWSSAAADAPGSNNLAGIKDPAVDRLVDRVIFAGNREELVAATHALDRVLLWGYYYIPQWHSPELRVAFWNKFGIPDAQPGYIGVDLESWWVLEEREAVIEDTYEDEGETE